MMRSPPIHKHVEVVDKVQNSGEDGDKKYFNPNF